MKNYIKIHYISVLILFLFIGCKNNTEKTEKDSEQKITKELSITANYVSEDYLKRSEGYDWVSVSVTKAKNNQLNISIRSRADNKKPTCTFDAIARKVDDKTYQTQIKGKTILFAFTDSKISITAKKQEDESLLYFYCSGGASISGTYSKIDEPLDQSQIDKTKFSKVLNLQDIGFNILSIEKDGKNTLTIFTFGLKEHEYNETFNIEGEEVINAEVEDLNSDGSPELFIYTQSVGSGSYGNVYAFSVNNKKSMSQVYFQPTAENSKINQGYMGHDEFSIVENTLGQRFPIYKEGDTNAKPTGGTRQVSYRLVEGEAMRKLEVHKITEY
ncbi:PliI family lysozyme inhibitor of I-type lysozyme [Polaribacter septentrionalilitoris]|uniref:PliI family lysozyme inhibitor of I-type lysozyme n=1 Tax=Polaribacter septentrionalilitoris TaxID=2494657 RepID=UPI001356B341|nr:PliI family lysozyme inhibitor of I-type lysozyme [Polaribacter septentrionalilitoris]